MYSSLALALGPNDANRPNRRLLSDSFHRFPAELVDFLREPPVRNHDHGEESGEEKLNGRDMKSRGIKSEGYRVSSTDGRRRLKQEGGRRDRKDTFGYTAPPPLRFRWKGSKGWGGDVLGAISSSELIR